MKELKSPATALDMPATSEGLNGRCAPGQGPSFGPCSRTDRRLRVLRGQLVVPGDEERVGFVDGAAGRGGDQAAVGREEVQVERFERHLGQVGDAHRQLPRGRVRGERRDDLRVDAEAAGDQECAVLVARQRLADVDRADQGPVQRRRADVEVADLRVVGAFGGAAAVEVRLRVRAGGLAVGRVRVDRDPFGQGQRRRAERGGRVREARGTGRLSAASRGRRRNRCDRWSARR